MRLCHVCKYYFAHDLVCRLTCEKKQIPSLVLLKKGKGNMPWRFGAWVGHKKPICSVIFRNVSLQAVPPIKGPKRTQQTCKLGPVAWFRRCMRCIGDFCPHFEEKLGNNIFRIFFIFTYAAVCQHNIEKKRSNHSSRAPRLNREGAPRRPLLWERVRNQQ